METSRERLRLKVRRATVIKTKDDERQRNEKGCAAEDRAATGDIQGSEGRKRLLKSTDRVTFVCLKAGGAENAASGVKDPSTVG